MNIYELNELIACIEAENRPEDNAIILSYYYKARSELVAEISKEINQILSKA